MRFSPLAQNLPLAPLIAVAMALSITAFARADFLLTDMTGLVFAEGSTDGGANHVVDSLPIALPPLPELVIDHVAVAGNGVDSSWAFEHKAADSWSVALSSEAIQFIGEARTYMFSNSPMAGLGEARLDYSARFTAPTEQVHMEYQLFASASADCSFDATLRVTNADTGAIHLELDESDADPGTTSILDLLVPTGTRLQVDMHFHALMDRSAMTGSSSGSMAASLWFSPEPGAGALLLLGVMVARTRR